MPIPYPRFEVGQAVVCVDDNFTVLLTNTILTPPATGNWALPRFGQVYTVRANIYGPNGWGVLLTEILNPPPNEGWPELNFHQDRFVPVQEAPTTVEEEVEEEVRIAAPKPAELVPA